MAASTVAMPPRAEAADPPLRPGIDLGPFPDLPAFVTGMYQGFLGRSPTAGERAAALQLVQQGEPTKTIVQRVWSSQFPNGPTSDVVRLYLALTKRPPAASEYRFWVQARRSGQSFERVTARVLAGSRYRWLTGLDDDGEFVSAVFQAVLGRTVDRSGLTYWRTKLARGTARSTFVATVVQSREHRYHRIDVGTRVDDVVAGYTFVAGTTGSGPGRAFDRALRFDDTPLALGAATDQLLGLPGYGARLAPVPFSFTATRALPLPAADPSSDAGNPEAIASGDLDGDGRTDLAARTLVGSYRYGVRVLPNRATGWTATDLPTDPISVGSITVADADGDGRDDVVLSGDGELQIVRQLGSGGFAAPEPVAYPDGVEPRWTVVGDFDGDGLPQVVAYGNGAAAEVRRAAGGTWTVARTWRDGDMAQLNDCAARNLDRTVADELVCFGVSGVGVWHQGADGFTRTGTSTHARPWGGFDAFDLGDVTGDGRVDLVTMDDGFGQNRFEVWPGRGDGTFGEPTLHWSPTDAGDVHLADLDGDRDLDVVISGGQPGWALARNLGAGRFGPLQQRGASGVSASLAVDVTLDGRADLVAFDPANARVVLEPSR